MKTSLKWLLFPILIGPMAFAQSDKDELATFKNALDQYKAEKYDAAIPVFGEIIKQKTELEEYAHFYLAQSYLKTGKVTEAEKQLEIIQKL